MLDVSLLFKIGAFGVCLFILDKVLKAAGKEDIATLTNLSGIVIILIMVLNLIAKLFDAVKVMFQF